MKNVSVLILAGGKSERMKSPKPFLLIEGKTFVEKIIEGYLKLGIENIFVILNHHFLQYIPKIPNDLKIILNQHPEYGRFYSIRAGLKKMPSSNYIFIHNVDNPFVDERVIKKMWKVRSPDGFVVPVYNGQGGHPILISEKIRDKILSIDNLSYTLRDIVRYYKRIEIEVDSEKILANINTWNEYESQVLNLIPEYCCA